MGGDAPAGSWRWRWPCLQRSSFMRYPQRPCCLVRRIPVVAGRTAPAPSRGASRRNARSRASVIEPRGDFRPGNGGRSDMAFAGIAMGLACFRRRSRNEFAHTREYSDTVEVKTCCNAHREPRYTARWPSAPDVAPRSEGLFLPDTNVETCCDENGDR